MSWTQKYKTLHAQQSALLRQGWITMKAWRLEQCARLEITESAVCNRIRRGTIRPPETMRLNQRVVFVKP